MLRLYTATDPNAYLDTSNQRSLISPHNRRSMTPYIDQLWVRNTDNTLWMTNIQVFASSTGSDITSGTNGFGFKFLSGELEPTERMWSAATYNQPVNLGNIGTAAAADTATFIPLWVRIEASPEEDVGLRTCDLIISYVEHAA